MTHARTWVLGLSWHGSIQKIKPFCDITSKKQVFMMYLVTFDSEYDIYRTKISKTGTF